MIATRLNITNNTDLQENGLNALKTALGVTGTLKFLEQFDNGGSGDYTAEKYKCEEPEPSDAEIRKMFGF
ncbi:hypothetical protein C808_02601 [Lachnospiraceae bacterium M18-1]|nr:hypothetical protein C808_02601 [Lachnospiraceae bacterium M18-1]